MTTHCHVSLEHEPTISYEKQRIVATCPLPTALVVPWLVTLCLAPPPRGLDELDPLLLKRDALDALLLEFESSDLLLAFRPGRVRSLRTSSEKAPYFQWVNAKCVTALSAQRCDLQQGSLA